MERAGSAKRDVGTAPVGWLAQARAAPGLAALLGMAVVGLGISIYLTTVHYAGVAPVCTVSGPVNCAVVTSSAYSVLPRTQIPVTIPGMLWFLVSGALALVGLRARVGERPEPARLRLAQLVWGTIGLLFVLYLVYAEIVLLHALCEWCTAVHLLTFATFLIALSRFLQPAAERAMSARALPERAGTAQSARSRMTAPTRRPPRRRR